MTIVGISMKKKVAVFFLPAFAISVAVAASGDTLCKSTERIVWSCHAGKKTYSVCASADLTSDAGYMQYRVGASAKSEFVYPASPSHPSGKFALNMGPHGASLDFDNSGFNYSIAEDARGLPLIFVDKNQKEIAKVQCRDSTGDLLENSTIVLLKNARVFDDR
jgi:hypothetical protein